jgi:hypothetical protein
VVGHEAERRRLVPAGGFSAVQVRPPERVLMMVEPVPVLPLLPTATQSLLFEHESPVMLTASLGVVPTDHTPPLLVVRIAYGLASRFVPPVTQKSVGWQLTVLRTPPLGSELGNPQLLPPLFVSRVVDPPPEAMPTATQVVPLEQDTAVSD